MPRKPFGHVFHYSVNVVVHNTTEARIYHRSWHIDRSAHTMRRKLNNCVEAKVARICLRYRVLHRPHHGKEYFPNPLDAAPVPPCVGCSLNIRKQCWTINYDQRTAADIDVVWMAEIPTYILNDGDVISV